MGSLGRWLFSLAAVCGLLVAHGCVTPKVSVRERPQFSEKTCLVFQDHSGLYFFLQEVMLERGWTLRQGDLAAWPTPTPTSIPTLNLPKETSTPTLTPTPKPRKKTATPTLTLTPKKTSTSTLTPTPKPLKNTPTPTLTLTPKKTATPTLTPTPRKPTRTFTPSKTPTPTKTWTVWTFRLTWTATPTPESVPVEEGPSSEGTPTVDLTPALSALPTATCTATPSLEATGATEGVVEQASVPTEESSEDPVVVVAEGGAIEPVAAVPVETIPFRLTVSDGDYYEDQYVGYEIHLADNVTGKEILSVMPPSCGCAVHRDKIVRSFIKAIDKAFKRD